MMIMILIFSSIMPRDTSTCLTHREGSLLLLTVTRFLLPVDERTAAGRGNMDSSLVGTGTHVVDFEGICTAAQGHHTRSDLRGGGRWGRW